MKLAIEILKREIAQRELAQRYDHLRKDEVQLELYSLNKIVKKLTMPIVSNSVCEYCGGWGYTEEGAIAVGCVCEDGKQTDC